jgi:hypothetical protein
MNVMGYHGKGMMLAVLFETVCCHFLRLQCLCSAVHKPSVVLPNIKTKILQSRIPHEKLGVAQQVIVIYGSWEKNK